MHLLLSQDKKQNREKKDNIIINKEKITDIHDNKYIETEDEYVNDLSNDSYENSKKITRLWTEK